MSGVSCTSASEASSNYSSRIHPKRASDRVTEIIDASYKLQDNLLALEATESTGVLWKSIESLCEIQLAVVHIELKLTQHKPIAEEEWSSCEWKKEWVEWQNRRSQRLLANARIIEIEYESSRTQVRKWSDTSSDSDLPASREPEQTSWDGEASGSASKKSPRKKDPFEHQNNAGLAIAKSPPVDGSTQGKVQHEQSKASSLNQRVARSNPQSSILAGTDTRDITEPEHDLAEHSFECRRNTLFQIMDDIPRKCTCAEASKGSRNLQGGP